MAVAAAIVLGLAGCAMPGVQDSGSQGDSAQSAGGGGPVEGAVPEKSSDTAVVTTGRMLISVDDPLVAADKAGTIALDAGGRIDGRRERAGDRSGGTARAELVLRIPADGLDKARTALAELGTRTETSFEAEDVSSSRRDLDARIKTLQTSIARYTGWLATAQKTSDLLELEKAISERQTELEKLEAEQRALDDRVSMATVTVVLFSDETPVTASPRSFGESLAAGWTVFAGFWASTGLAVAFALPWLIVIALITGVAVWLVRRRRRRGAEGATGRAPMPPAPRAMVPGPAQDPSTRSAVTVTPVSGETTGGEAPPHDAPR